MTREGLKRKSKGFELTWTAIEHQVGIQMMHELDQTTREKVLSFNKLVTLPEPTLFYEENVGRGLASTQDFVKRRYREMLALTEKAEQK